MYNVMLVDDDYPVTQLLSEAIPWEGLGLHLMGSYENGWSAWEQAQREMPDILITDIGMPRMDGLELSARIRGMSPHVRIAILSCHSEFEYAQQAMRLNVQDYLLKDTLDPEDVAAVLRRFKDHMDEEAHNGWEQSRMKHLVVETSELRKEQLLASLIDQPLFSAQKWEQEAREYGLFLPGQSCLPAIGYVENYQTVKHRFASDRTLHFAIGNVLGEVWNGLPLQGLHVRYDAGTSILLFSHTPSLKRNAADEAAACLQEMQSTLRRVLKVGMSFVLGESCGGAESLKQKLGELLNGESVRFYLEPGEIAKRSEKALDSAGDGERPNLFAFYDRANAELREALLGKNPSLAGSITDQWMSMIGRARYSPETVKDWTLKLLLDLKLKLHSLHSIRPSYSAESLHKELVDIYSLSELGAWLKGHLERIAALTEAGSGASRRTEVAEACRYVSLRLHTRISLDEAAGHLHLNPSYFSRLFKKETGMTFIEYITRMKMERAKELLDGTRHSVGEIGEMLGYDNQSYFIKTFKGYTGATPMEYRR
ncbi:helix-turn-helix domain-containing protein [Paenibacillus macerans]|uniref:Helix-turn-helix domain-containing protein n=3 Tax=Paenibacillus TaxID=44249 RepID=A0A6N8EQ91_PAEMA|nr:helix-turn-helix domain-containing protein [Paenibacillus macerans]MBS5914266.1 helix-turn-helix domain-containing protein [Paenibacillus macerans]MUG20832.1 helix-turn-helix domain-containing protein [Paenibacillus macerans]UMV48850.1 AraC family transcriptional regulator [Paenibacillus macerans]